MAELGLRWDEVRLSEWTPLWADSFEAEAAPIRRSCPEAIIEHVGSTAVVDLPAKPILDISSGLRPGD